jgi:hypothetical protein
LRTSEPFKSRGVDAETSLRADRHAIETDVNGTVGFVLQQVDREVRAFADHAFADAIHQ